jgi:hypothetical protein
LAASKFSIFAFASSEPVREHIESSESFVIQGRRPDSIGGPPMWTSKNRRRDDRSRLRYPSDLTDEEWAIRTRDIRFAPDWRIQMRLGASRPKRHLKEILRDGQTMVDEALAGASATGGPR